MNTRTRFGLIAISCVLALVPAAAVNAAPGDELTCRIIDVGAGLCAAIKAPKAGGGFEYMIYDAGNDAAHVRTSMQEIIPAGKNVKLMVLSHSDSDHLGEVPWICDTYHIERVLRTGYTRPSGIATYWDAVAAIEDEVANDGCIDHNFKTDPVPHGTAYSVGDATVTVLAGWNVAPSVWASRVRTNDSKRRNAISICVRIEYKGRSILFTGDGVGRWDKDPEDSIIATEKYLDDHKAARPIDSDVLISAHHGADNGTSLPFLRAVTPLFVVFPAGTKYAHPRWSTVERCVTAGVRLHRMLRTDLGDDDGVGEWRFGRIPGNNDPRGDDDIDIRIFERSNGQGWVDVDYVN